MKRILIIPDIHHRWERVEKIIKAEGPDKVIFLGDYFDDFGDNAEVARQTAIWLKGSLKDPKRIHLRGNHDVHYEFLNNWIKCSGYELGKDMSINNVMEKSDWDKLHWYHFESNILFSHAGLDVSFIKCRPDGVNLEWLKKHLSEQVSEAAKAAEEGRPHWIYNAGSARGGRQKIGGLIWCDFDVEFQGVPGLKQVVGHTPRRVFSCDDAAFFAEYGKDQDNMCLDTHSNHYGIMIDGKIEIKAYANL